MCSHRATVTASAGARRSPRLDVTSAVDPLQNTIASISLLASAHSLGDLVLRQPIANFGGPAVQGSVTPKVPNRPRVPRVQTPALSNPAAKGKSYLRACHHVPGLCAQTWCGARGSASHASARMMMTMMTLKQVRPTVVRGVAFQA